MDNLEGKRILFIIAHEVFRDEEYKIPREIFDKEGAAVIVASSELSTAVGKYGMKVNPDILMQDAKPADYDAIVFAGGAGCKEFWNDIHANNLAKRFHKSRKLTAAICSAPVILAYSGILKGRKATCFQDDREHLLKNGAHFVTDDVVIDGNIITANGYQASEQFANTIVKELQKARRSSE